MKSSVLLALVSAICLALLAVPANAQATRTWVSGVGDDVNPCSRTAPCKTFAGAISKTSTGGEINCLDPGGFGALTITKAISIICHPVSNGGVLVSGTAGFTVAVPAGSVVYLEGLDFEGIGSGTNGVQVNSGGTVYIIDCSIRDFTGNGVNVTSTTSGQRVIIKDSIIENNAGGVNVQGSGVGNSTAVENSLIDSNSSFAVQVGTSGNVIALVNSILEGSPAGIINGGGSVVSFGPSNLIGGTGSVTSTTIWK
jgi:hypothetical protein